MKFIDLFAGCGGLSLGLSSSGLEPMFAVEKNPKAFRTYQHNLIDKFQHRWPNGLPQVAMTVSSMLNSQRKKALLKSLAGEVDLVAGGPPCQGFSSLGRRDSNDPRNKLFLEYLSFVRLTRPRMVLLENVAGMKAAFGAGNLGGTVDKYGKSTAEVLQGKLEKLGYKVLFEDVLISSRFGVPQRRPRYILIAAREDCLGNDAANLARICGEISELLEEERDYFLTRKGLSLTEPVTAGDAISDLETKKRTTDYVEDPPLGGPSSNGFKHVVYSKPKTPYQSLMHGKLNGQAPNSSRLPNHRNETRARFEQLHDLVEKGKLNSGASIPRPILEKVGVRKHYLSLLSKKKPSPTISTLPDDVLHYDEPRILTVRESARLQSFPDNFEFTGNYTTGGDRRRDDCPRYTQVGNAVPPLLAEFLGNFIARIEAEYLV